MSGHQLHVVLMQTVVVMEETVAVIVSKTVKVWIMETTNHVMAAVTM